LLFLFSSSPLQQHRRLCASWEARQTRRQRKFTRSLKYDLRRVYQNNFSSPQKIAREEDFIKESPDGAWHRIGKPDPNAEWIAEGWGGAAVSEGKLRVAPSPFDSKAHLNSSGAATALTWLYGTGAFSHQTFCLNTKWIRVSQPAV
jgi:hypothetical protein